MILAFSIKEIRVDKKINLSSVTWTIECISKQKFGKNTGHMDTQLVKGIKNVHLRLIMLIEGIVSCPHFHDAI